MSYLEIKNITKTFGNTIALDNVSLSLEENKIYGLLGRNGAGKTTLLNLITDRIFPTYGEILLNGEKISDNEAALSNIYYMSEPNYYPESMTVRKALKWTGEFYKDFNSEYATVLCNKFNLNADKKIRALSTGYQSIFKIIVALSCNAPIILLDEPVLGLDANHRELFYKELIQSYSERPRTIVLSTHLIEEVAELIEYVIVIKDGKVIMQDSVESVLSQGYSVSGTSASVDNFIKGKNVIGIDTLGGLKTAYVLERPERDNLPDGLEISGLNLQKLFIRLTN